MAIEHDQSRSTLLNSAPQGASRSVIAAPNSPTTDDKQGKARTTPSLLLLTAPLLGALILVAACLVWVSVRNVHFAWETSHPEAAVAYNTLNFLDSGKIYPQLDEPPFTPVVYMPLYFILLGISGKIGHLGMEGVLYAGRTVSLLAYLLIGLLVYRWGRREGAAATLAIIGAGFAIAQYDAFPWNVTARPDLPAILLALAGLYLLSYARSERWVVASGICLSLALLLKQTVIAAPLAAGVWLLLQRQVRRAAILTAATALPVLGLLAVLQLRGDHFLANMSALRQAGDSFQGALDLLHREFGSGWNPEYTLLALAIVGVVSAFLKPTPPRRLIALYFLVSWMVTLRTISHVGSNYNYFLEPWTVSSLLAVLGLMQLHEWAGSGRVFVVLVVLCAYPFLNGYEQPSRLLKDDGLPKPGSLTKLVQGRTVLTDIPYLSIHSQTPELLDSYYVSLLEGHGLWKSDPIVGKLHAHHYDLVLIGINPGGVRRYRGTSFVSASIANEIRANYSPVCVLQVRKDAGLLGYSGVLALTPDDAVAGAAVRAALAGPGCREIDLVRRPDTPQARWYKALNW